MFSFDAPRIPAMSLAVKVACEDAAMPVAVKVECNDGARAPTPTTISPPYDTADPSPSKADDAANPAKRAKRSKFAAKSAAVDVECAEGDALCEGKTPDTGTWLVVAKAVRLHLKNHETVMHCGSDVLPALNAKLAELIREAIVRAQQNGRKTIKACDF